MGKLYPYYQFNGIRLLLEKNIVDLLTTNEFRTSLLWKENPSEQGFPDIIGINSVCNGKPIRWGKNIYERGLENLKQRTIYFIDAENKSLYISERHTNLFYDADKVDTGHQFVWEGEFQEILNEFLRRGYQIKDKVPV